MTEPLKEEILKGDVHTIEEMKAWLKSFGYSDAINDVRDLSPAIREISIEALELNYANNPKLSHSSIRKELQSKGYHISSKNKQCFSEEELDQYYSGALEFWNDFCSNIHIYSPEGALLHKHLLNLPDDPRYRWAFFK